MTEQDYVAAVCRVELEVMNQLKASNISQDPFRLDGEKIMVAAIPEGYVLVPVEPTDAMLVAARDWSVKKYGQAVGNDGASGCYKAMIQAAREPT